MNLLGHAVVAIWNDILPDERTTFIERHNREQSGPHEPELRARGLHRRRLPAGRGKTRNRAHKAHKKALTNRDRQLLMLVEGLVAACGRANARLRIFGH